MQPKDEKGDDMAVSVMVDCGATVSTTARWNWLEGSANELTGACSERLE